MDKRDQAQGPIGDLVAGLRGSSRERLLERRTQRRGQSRAITIDGEHAIEASEGEKARAALLLRRCVRVQPEMRARPAGFFDVADVAVRIAGLGSLGMERYIALVAGEGGPDGMRLIDIKRARASCAVAASRLRQPGWSCEAERVAAVQGRMQARPPAFLGQVADRSRSYVIRELQPREDRLDLAGLAGVGGAQLETAIESFARLAAWAHLRGAGRQGAAGAEALAEYGQKEKWRERLLLAATQCAARSRADWQGFCKAFDAGAFRQGSSGSL